MANSVEPDQMPHFAASDLGLHCLPRSVLTNARVNNNGIFFSTGLAFIVFDLVVKLLACLLYIIRVGIDDITLYQW